MSSTIYYTALFIFIIFSLSCTNSKKTIINKTENTINAPLQNTYWKLTELMGQPIKGSGNNKNAYINLVLKGKVLEEIVAAILSEEVISYLTVLIFYLGR